MKSLFVVVLALTAIATAVEAKGKTKKRGLEEAVLGYVQQNYAFPFGGPLDLGSLQGIELSSYEALASGLGSGLGGHGLPLAGLQDISFGQYGSALALGGAGLHDLTLLLGSGGQHGSGLASSYGYGGGYGLGAGYGLGSGYGSGSGYGLGSRYLPPQLVQAAPPASVPQVVSPTAAAAVAAISQQPPINRARPFGATAPGVLVAPAPPPVPPTAFPPASPAQAIPTPVQPPAPLQVAVPLPALAPRLVPAPAPASVPASAPAPVPASAAASVPASAPAPSPVPASAPARANTPPNGGRLGSGSLGYTNLGNGLFALGSGSLGYTSTSSANPPPGQVQGLQINLRFSGLQTAAVGLNTVPQAGYGGQGAGLDSVYGGYSLSGERLGSGQADLNSGLNGLNSGFGGDTNLLGYGSGAILSKGY